MKRSPWFPLFGATLLASFGLPAQELRAQDYSRLPVVTREAAAVREVPARDQIPVIPVGEPIVNVLPSQIKNLPDVNGNLKVVHRRSQLIIAKGNVVRTAIADPGVCDIVQYSPNEIAVIGMSLGSTTVTMWFDDGSEPLIYLVETVRDPSIEDRKKVDYGKLEKKLAALFPNSKVYLIPMSYKIIVKGQARDSEEASRILSLIAGEVINQVGSLAGPQPAAIPGTDPVGLINSNNLASGFIVNMLDVPGEFQVMLRVRIAELNRSQLRKLGINVAVLINDGQNFFSSVLSGAISAGGVAAAANAPITGIFSSGDVAVLINALHSNGTAKILAEPVLTVLSGHPASFLSGGEFAVPTIVGVQGVGAQQTTFRGFGTSLLVTPTVLDKDNIRLQIMPEFSKVTGQNNVNGIPGLGVRRAQTTVQLREGQTIAIAGLMSNQTTTEVASIPYLVGIPIIGPLLFAAKQATEDETELIILVTPELVRPMEPDEVPPVPGHEVTQPDDCLLYWKARTEGAPYQRVNQLAPYGHGSGHPEEVGYRQYNPNPAEQGYHPAVTGGFGGGYGAPATFGPPQAGRYQQGPPGGIRQPIPASAPQMQQGPANMGPRNMGPQQGPTPVNPSASRWNPFSRTPPVMPASATRQQGPQGQQTYPAGGYPSQYAPRNGAQTSPGGYTIPRSSGNRY